MNILFPFLFVEPLSMPKSLKRSPEGFGVGIYMGAPTGLGALNVAHREKGITRQVYLNWNFDNDQLRGVVDQVWEIHKVRLEDGTQFPVYIGGRTWFRLNDVSTTLGFTGFSNSIGVGIPVGALYQHESVAIEGYVECTPVFQIAPISDFGLQVGVGIRLFPSFL
jgi:hypothetical protein